MKYIVSKRKHIFKQSKSLKMCSNISKTKWNCFCF